MNFRTDLAVEAAVSCRAGTEDVEQNSRNIGTLVLHTTRILTPKGEAAVGKPRGRYITAVLPSLTDHEGDFAAYAAAIGEELAGMLPPEGTVLVVGLGRTVQMTDSGIAPGSGVGNDRRPLNREVLGVPVIGLGVPTVVDAVLDGTTPMMVTPREVDLMISRAARLLAMSIHVALQPAYSPMELMEVARGM